MKSALSNCKINGKGNGSCLWIHLRDRPWYINFYFHTHTTTHMHIHTKHAHTFWPLPSNQIFWHLMHHNGGLATRTYTYTMQTHLPYFGITCRTNKLEYSFPTSPLVCSHGQTFLCTVACHTRRQSWLAFDTQILYCVLQVACHARA